MIEIIFFNVGQGNSILILLNNETQIKACIIDCYMDMDLQEEPKVLTYLKERGIDEIEFLVITHPHEDHFFGISKILNYYTDECRKIHKIIETPINPYLCGLSRYNGVTEDINDDVEFKSRCLNELKSYNDIIKRNEIKRIPNKSLLNEKIVIDSDTYLFLLSPTIDTFNEINQKLIKNIERLKVNKKLKDIDLNKICLSFIFVYKGIKLLIMGDVKDQEWKSIIKNYKKSFDLCSDIISIGHHGSNQGNPKDLWEKISIQNKSISVISCGYNNKFKHPSILVLNRILNSNNILKCTNLGEPCKKYADKYEIHEFAKALLLDDKEGILKGLLSEEGAYPIGACMGDIHISTEDDNQSFSIQTEFDKCCLFKKYDYHSK